MKLLTTLVGILVGLVALASPAQADDSEFIAETDRVIVMHTHDDPDGHWVGYPRVPIGLRMQVAYGVCERLDGGAPSANDYIVAALDDRREHAGYLASWFQQSAIKHYCPRHSDKLGTI